MDQFASKPAKRPATAKKLEYDMGGKGSQLAI